MFNVSEVSAHFEVKHFIKEVQKYPCLYDPTVPGYRDMQLSDRIWREIADTLKTENVQLDGSEWKKKWRNLRDTYVKKRREEALGITRKWWLAESMSFLEPFITGRGASSTVSSDSETSLKLGHQTSFYGSTSSLRDGSPLESLQDEDIKPNLLDDSATLMQTSENGSVDDSQDAASSAECQGCVTLGLPQRSRKRKAPSSSSPKSLPAQPPRVSSAGDSIPYLPDTTSLPPVVDTAENAFFYSCSLRAQRLPHQTRSLLMLQVAQLFYSAENPELVTMAPLACRRDDTAVGSDAMSQ